VDEPGDAARRHLHPVEQVERALHQLANRPQLALALALRELEHAALGLVEDGLQLAGVLARELEDLAPHVRQAPPTDWSLTIRAYSTALEARGTTWSSVMQICRTADAGELPSSLQLLGEGEVVDRRCRPSRASIAAKICEWAGLEKIVREDDLGDRGHHGVVPQDRPEHGALGGEIFGLLTDRLDDGHRSPLPAGAAQDPSAP
jgi:hypothetical protein